MRSRAPTCVRCGYDLTGIGAGSDWATCPECGLTFDPARPHPREWPHPVRLAFRLAWPPTLAVGVAAAATVAAEALLARAPMAAVWAVPILLALYAVVIAAPVYAAGRVASVHAVRYERALIWTLLAALGEVYAIGLVFAAFLVTDRIWP